ncbi:pyridoxamine 5'-phosphate oxidase family protein [Geothrix alkalitolerans]|uniref:pyridoxamine 5'-phosphate oxidase family protein n=1 Tax=Geothrix alkalitolerans TaxID=2922724 RepID=UPI001FAF814D|nr:pyridoxamine 5'-phosphate oxidase family protein [Geothrix alkalitolerans]
MDPFHDGERAVQARTGETGTALLNSRLIEPSIMPGAHPFIARQPWAVLASLDAAGRLWCSAMVGEPGFAQATADGSSLNFDLRRAPVHSDNHLFTSHLVGRPAGALFLEPATRRRLRVNGRISESTASELRLEVAEAFPNCPKFIRPRDLDGLRQRSPRPIEARWGGRLDADIATRLAAADTVFLATLHPGRGVDASHRGGPLGFVEVLDERTLRFPDYAGNGLFQSFGNLAVDPRAALLVADFERGDLLHLTGGAEVIFDEADPSGLSGGTGRFLHFHVDQWVLTPPPS